MLALFHTTRSGALDVVRQAVTKLVGLLEALLSGGNALPRFIATTFPMLEQFTRIDQLLDTLEYGLTVVRSLAANASLLGDISHVRAEGGTLFVTLRAAMLSVESYDDPVGAFETALHQLIISGPMGGLRMIEESVAPLASINGAATAVEAALSTPSHLLGLVEPLLYQLDVADAAAAICSARRSVAVAAVSVVTEDEDEDERGLALAEMARAAESLHGTTTELAGGLAARLRASLWALAKSDDGFGDCMADGACSSQLIVDMLAVHRNLRAQSAALGSLTDLGHAIDDIGASASAASALTRKHAPSLDAAAIWGLATSALALSEATALAKYSAAACMVADLVPSWAGQCADDNTAAVHPWVGAGASLGGISEFAAVVEAPFISRMALAAASKGLSELERISGDARAAATSFLTPRVQSLESSFGGVTASINAQVQTLPTLQRMSEGLTSVHNAYGEVRRIFEGNPLRGR